MSQTKKSTQEDFSKKKKKKLGNFVIDEDSDYPVHEEYVKERPTKN
ncbi:hypothetical protein J4437_02740 [Candidatus Woesearchaeota archaeon]|nr:hypothetical protein [Candidatus Woesearchaeota archaeon]